MSSEVQFNGNNLTTNAAGYRAPIKVYRDHMKNEGVPAEMIDKVTAAHEKLLGKGLEFCSERIIAEDKPKITLVIPASDTLTLDATVHKCYERPAPKIQEKDADGNGVVDGEGNPVYKNLSPTRQIGRCEVGMTLKLSDHLIGVRDNISKSIAAAYNY